MATPLQQPSSPSTARQIRQPSPTSPSYAEHQYKRSLLDDVKTWSENRVTDWLSNQALGRFSQKFIGSFLYYRNEGRNTLLITHFPNRTQHLGFSFT
jgi:hypothetical protein